MTCGECGEVAEVADEYTLPSTDGPVVHVVTVCPNQHRLTRIICGLYGDSDVGYCRCTLPPRHPGKHGCEHGAW